MDGRQEVSDGFPRTGAGLHQEVLAPVEGLGHGSKHFHLLGAILVAGKLTGEIAALLQHSRQGVHVQQLPLLPLFGGLEGLHSFFLGEEQAHGALTVQGPFGHQLLADAAGEGEADLIALQVLEDRPKRPVTPGGQTVDLADDAEVQLRGLLQEPQEKVLGGQGVVQGAVPGGEGDAQSVGQGAQAVTRSMGQKDTGQFKGVNGRVVQKEIVAFQETQVERHIVADDGIILDKAPQGADDRGQSRGLIGLGLSDARQLGNFVRDGALGIDQAGPGLQHLVLAELDHSNLDDSVVFGPQAGGLQVQSHVDSAHGVPI